VTDKDRSAKTREDARRGRGRRERADTPGACAGSGRGLLAVALAGVAVAGLALVAGAAAEEPTGAATSVTPQMPPIVARSIDFHGGEALRRSQVALTLRSKSGEYRITAWNDGATFDYVVTEPAAEGGRRVRFTNAGGDNEISEWRDGRRVELDAEAAARAERFVSARVYFPFLPFRLADPGVHFEDQGLERWGDLELHEVKVTFRPGSSAGAEDEYVYWFDPETGRMEQFAYSFAGGLRLRRALSFERHGGILLSDQENLGIDERGLSVDAVTPDFVAARMEPVSVVEVDDVEVTPRTEADREAPVE
jgi:hypothetical protein